VRQSSCKVALNNEVLFDWQEIVRTGAGCGLKPNEIWELELWEYNNYINAFEIKQKENVAQAILNGFYTAYYMNGGKKTKNPNELIKNLYADETPKQALNDGLADIEQIIKLEKSIAQGKKKTEG